MHPTRSEAPAAGHNLLALSDLHLGHGLGTGPEVAPVADERLVAWLDHHAAHPRGGLPWRLLLNGDVFDFVAVTAVPGPGEVVTFEVDDEERRFGLRASEDKGIWKLQRIARRHRAAFAALARFVARGHELVVLVGNHDLDLAWPGVREALGELLLEHARPADPNAFLARLSYCDRGYLEPGRIWVEHGNAYDPFCLHDDPLPGEQELSLPVSSLVLRYFANRHAAQGEIEQASDWGAAEFLAWFAKTPAPWRVALDYVAMIGRILGHQAARRRVQRGRPHAPGALEQLRQLALAAGPHRRHPVADLAAVVAEPALVSVVRVLQLFYLERIALVWLALMAVSTALAARPWLEGLGFAVAVGAALGLVMPALARARRTEAHPLLEAASHRLADLFGVPLVVMGHTHRPVEQLTGQEGRYVNLGSWTHPGPRGFPYLLVAPGEAGLRFWPAAEPLPAEVSAPTPVSMPALAGRAA